MIKDGALKTLVFLTLFTFSILFPLTGSAEDVAAGSPSSAEPAESIIAGLSDEQVREMLISELRASSMEEQYAQEQTMVGPAGLFNRLLKKLSGEHTDNEEQFRKLWGGISTIVPDLRKVFLTL